MDKRFREPCEEGHLSSRTSRRKCHGYVHKRQRCKPRAHPRAGVSRRQKTDPTSGQRKHAQCCVPSRSEAQSENRVENRAAQSADSEGELPGDPSALQREEDPSSRDRKRHHQGEYGEVRLPDQAELGAAEAKISGGPEDQVESQHPGEPDLTAEPGRAVDLKKQRCNDEKECACYRDDEDRVVGKELPERRTWLRFGRLFEPRADRLVRRLYV